MLVPGDGRAGGRQVMAGPSSDLVPVASVLISPQPVEMHKRANVHEMGFLHGFGVFVSLGVIYSKSPPPADIFSLSAGSC